MKDASAIPEGARVSFAAWDARDTGN